MEKEILQKLIIEMETRLESLKLALEKEIEGFDMVKAEGVVEELTFQIKELKGYLRQLERDRNILFNYEIPF